MSTLQISMLKLAWSLSHTELILQGSYSLFGEATESAQDPVDGARVVIPQLPLQHRGQRALLQPHLCSQRQWCMSSSSCSIGP